jgi:hypothetical protein
MKSVMRNLKNSVMNYDECEIRVREATSNEAWGAPSSLMLEIAEDTHHRYKYRSTVDMINKRLTDYQHLNHVLKALMLIEFLLRHGDVRFVQDMQDRNKVIIRRLRGYKYYKDNKEIGGNVRKWASKVLGLLENAEELQKERENAKNTKDKIQGYSNDSFPEKRSSEFRSSEFHLEFKPDDRASKAQEGFGEIEFDNEMPEDDPPVAKKVQPPSSQGKKKGQSKKQNDDADEDNENDADFDPDAYAPKKKTSEAKEKKKTKKKAVKKQESDEDEEDKNKGGDFQFDENGNEDFAFEETEKNRKSADVQKSKKKSAAADVDDFLLNISAAPASNPAPMALPAPVDNTQAIFDLGGNPASNKQGMNSQKKPQTLNQMGGTEVVPFDFGAAMAGQPYAQHGNAYPTPMMGNQMPNPYAPNPYAANPNPYGYNAQGYPASTPYGAPNPYGAPAANAYPYGQPQANPFGMPPQQQPAPQQKAAAPAKADPFAEFSW